MDKILLLDSIRQLEKTEAGTSSFAFPQAVRQFNALLEFAKSVYASRPDIKCIEPYHYPGITPRNELVDSIRRLRLALELRLPGNIMEMASNIKLPPDAPTGINSDLEELKEAVELRMRKTALLLSGSIAEALLLVRHPDPTDRGPGLNQLIKEASNKNLFGRDTLRQLEALNDYRDLIHARAAQRNKIVLNDARVENSIMALKLLCSELKDPTVRF